MCTTFEKRTRFSAKTGAFDKLKKGGLKKMKMFENLNTIHAR